MRFVSFFLGISLFIIFYSFFLFVADAMPLLVIACGAVGGIILTVAIILAVIFCRRHLSAAAASKKLDTSMSTSDQIMSIKPQAQKQHKSHSGGVGETGDSSDTDTKVTTSSDEVSNNSGSDLKVSEFPLYILFSHPVVLLLLIRLFALVQ